MKNKIVGQKSQRVASLSFARFLFSDFDGPISQLGLAGLVTPQADWALTMGITLVFSMQDHTAIWKTG